MTKSSKQHVTADFLGTNSLVIRDDKTTILIDPYFTRVSKAAFLFRKIQSNPKIVAQALAQAGVKEAAAILVTHTHVDHALDIAQAARITGAVVCGSLSTANVCRGESLPESQIKIIEPGEPVNFGDFSVRFAPGKHLAFPKLLSLAFGPGREILAPLKQPARAWTFAEGGCFSLHFEHPLGSFFNQGSANWMPGALEGYPADVGLLGIGGLDLNDEAYWDEWFDQTVGPTRPERVYLTHWDDFAISLSKPPEYLRNCEKVFLHLQDRAARSGSPSIELMPWKGGIMLF